VKYEIKKIKKISENHLTSQTTYITIELETKTKERR